MRGPGMQKDTEVVTTDGNPSDYIIPSSDADYTDNVELRYVFENEEDAK